MAENKNVEPQSGVLTSSMDIRSKEFRKFQLFLSEKANSLNEKQKLQIDLFAIQIKIEDYLNSDETENNLITVGDFLRLYMDRLNIKQNKLAEYIGLNPSNFNKILSGNRKLNFELSFMLGHIFNIDPKAWMLIQIKNEYLKLKKEKTAYFQNFRLEDLVKV